MAGHLIANYYQVFDRLGNRLGNQLQKDYVCILMLTGWIGNKEDKYDPELQLYRWMLEEHHVSLFVRQSGIKTPVLGKRLEKW